MHQLELSFKKGVLQVNNNPYRKLVQPPTTRDIVKAQKDDKLHWRKVKTVAGNTILRERCYFQGYSVVTNKIEVICDGYYKLRKLHGDARHIVCAYRLPGKNFAILQDYQDDNETNAGAELLKMLDEAQIFNRAVYVI